MTDIFKPSSGVRSESPPITPAPPSHAPMPSAKRGRNKREGWRSIFSTVAILLVAPLFALLLITFVFQSYLVDGPSMEMTLHDKDRLLVWKLPRTWSRITGNPYIPERGEIIVFTQPKLTEFGQSSGKQLIKRVIALPGERVAVDNGRLTVYNDEHPDGFQPDADLPRDAIAGTTSGELDVTVPDGHIFVAGDNRSNSLDSRAFGPISADNIVGKLAVRFLPLNKVQKF